MTAGVGAWCSEGLQHILELMNGVQSKPANYYVWLVTDETIAVDSNLAALTPITGDGYAPQAIAASGVGMVSASDGADGWQLTTAIVTFQSTGGAWSTAKHAILATANTTAGKMVGKVLLNSTTGVTVPAGYKFDVQMVLKQPVPA